MNTPVIIGIAGGSASGKSTFARKIVDYFNEPISVLCHDYYYKPFKEMSFEERTKQNYDHPSSFDTGLLIKHLKALKAGKAVYRPTYSYKNFTRLKDTVRVEPTKVIVVDGILIFENEELRNLMDIKIFVDADDDIIPQSRQFCVGIPVICPVFLTESFCFCLIGIRYIDVLSGHVFQRSQRHGGSHVSDSDK